MSQQKGQALQDPFLNTLRKEHVPVSIFLVNGIKLQGQIESFDQFVISYFLAPPGTSTLPVEIYTSIRKGFTPEINAISSIIILFSMGLMLIVARNYKFGGDNQ